jgi:hypothetical protein
VAVESLSVVGHVHRWVSDLDAARTTSYRARQIAEDRGLGAARIGALDDLATIAMLVDRGVMVLIDVRQLAYGVGLLSITATVDLQLAGILSLGTDLDQAFDAAVHCEQSARRFDGRRREAAAISHQALVHGIRGDVRQAREAARRAEAITPAIPRPC